MIISFEASANVDTNSFGYFSMKYDPDFFADIKENLTEIAKSEPLSFSLGTDDIKLVFGEYHSVRKLLKIADIEQQKFTDEVKVDFNNISFKRFKKVKLHIDKDYFYFTGYYETKNSHQNIKFQSLNFDSRFIDSLDNKYKKTVVE
jgi:imidazoleglycerol phosphate synthase glutamine amidotransferase subunit HisH